MFTQERASLHIYRNQRTYFFIQFWEGFRLDLWKDLRFLTTKEVMESYFPEMAEQEAWQQEWGEERGNPRKRAAAGREGRI